MGIGTSLFSGVFFGLIAGVSISITAVFIKSWLEKRKALKSFNQKKIIKE